MTLIVVGLGSVVGVIPHWRRGNLNGKTGVVFGSATMVGAYLGARLATQPWITARFQMALFSVAVLLGAGLMIRRAGKSEPSPEAVQHEIFYQASICKYCWLWLMTEWSRIISAEFSILALSWRRTIPGATLFKQPLILVSYH
jgi:uncharacterized membrane protein YfcA